MARREVDEDELETHRIAVTSWIAPVASADELPDEVEDGALCYVRGVEGDAVWQFRRGVGWSAVKTKRR